ncbi:MAG: hypothetical protein DRJ51_08045 [Thermoprotei archaeon]|nr:MAG: hypothetical protein DRJ51_08045 [Thermoprotei archaeon]RLF00817.1 MAG: hypothetical protein DRJ59_06910 [Thermoprotei archaeon]
MKSCINGATTMPYSLKQDILSAKEAGFKAVEVWVDKLKRFLQTETKGYLKRLLEETGLVAPCLCAFGGLIFCTDEEYKKRVLDLRRILEVGNYIETEYIILCAEGLGGKSFEEAKKRYVARLRDLGKVTMEYGIKIALEWFEELPPAIEIVQATDSEHVGLLIDTFHWYRGDGNLESLKLVPGEKLFFVHINDCEDLPRDQLTDKHRLFCGRGVIPLVDIFRIFKEKNYTGFLSVEIFREEYWQMDPVEISKRALESLKEVALKAGIAVS